MRFSDIAAYHRWCEKNPEWLKASSPGGVAFKLGLTRQGVSAAIHRGRLRAAIIGGGEGGRAYVLVPDFAVKEYLHTRGCVRQQASV